MLPQEEPLMARGALQWRNSVPLPQMSYSPTQLTSAEHLAFATSRSENVLLTNSLQYVFAFLEYTTSNKHKGEISITYQIEH